MNKLVYFLLIVAVLITGYMLWPNADSNKQVIGISTNSGTVNVSVEIADEPGERAKGLMFRETLGEDAGMLFIYGDEKVRSFWMKNTLIPLDMIFISSDFTIVDIKENAIPCELDPCPSYKSNKPAQYVLEVNAGFVRDHNIEINSSLILKE